MIEIFKTNVQSKAQAKKIIGMLASTFSEAQFNFDLADRDKILRVEGINDQHSLAIVNNVTHIGFECELLN